MQGLQPVIHKKIMTATSTETIQRVDQVIVFNYLRPIDSMLLRSYAHMYILSIDIRDIERPKVDICLLKSVEQLMYLSGILYKSSVGHKNLINCQTHLWANYSGKFTGVYNGHEFF